MRIIRTALTVSTLMWAGVAQAQATSDAPQADTPATAEAAQTAEVAPVAATPAPSPAPSQPMSATMTVDQAPMHGPGIERGNWYLGIGLGVGGSSLADDAIGGGLAGMTSFRAGAIIADRLLIGGQMALTGQFNKWAAMEPTGAALSSVMAEGMYFPMADLPLNVAAGFGWGSALKVSRLADNGDSPRVVTQSGNGVAWMAGVGWDLFAGEGLNLGLQARYDGTHSGNIGTSHAGTMNLWFNFY